MSGKLQLTILGCGSSGGVPRVGGDWGACDPKNPKNRRSRCSLWVEYTANEKSDPTCVLIDTSPDLREQLLDINAQHIDAIFLTHEHADQTHGIDDVRALAYRKRERIPTYMNAHTRNDIMGKFKYCFEMPEGRVHPPILELQPDLSPGDSISVSGKGGDLKIHVLELSHGPTPVLGFIFDGRAAYTPDVWDIPDADLDVIKGCDVWIVDGLRYNVHPTHAHIDKALMWLARTAVPKGIITNMHIDVDYDILSKELPGHHIAAYDGMVVSV